MKAIVIIACLALGLVGCSQEEPKPAPPKPATAAATATAKPSVVASAAEPNSELDSEDIPVAEDFEEQTAKDITADNLTQELDKIEKEMAAQKDG
jgi:PBP1b-binding outer membrane lipoprotein LpoB